MAILSIKRYKELKHFSVLSFDSFGCLELCEKKSEMLINIVRCQNTIIELMCMMIVKMQDDDVIEFK